MKKNKVPIQPFLGLLLVALMMVPAQATQVKMMTVSGGSGMTTDGTHRLKLTLSQSVIGVTEPDPGNIGIGLGLWEILSRMYVVSAADDDVPAVSNHLFRNYPNPFNPSTRINFSLEQKATVRIELYDLRGRKVDTLLQEVKPAGAHSLTYQPRNLASGVYLVLMRAGSFRATQRIMLVK